MTWFIISKDGERQVVMSLDGYDDWTVDGQSEEAPPEDGTWNGAGWAVDQTALAAKDELAEVTNRQRLRQALKAARNRITTLENRQTQLIAAVQDLQARVTTLEGAP